MVLFTDQEAAILLGGESLAVTFEVQAKCLTGVSGGWARKLWLEYRLASNVFEEHLYLCKSKLTANKRNFDLVLHCKHTRELAERDEERSKHWASVVFGHRAGSCELAWAKDFGSDLRSTSKVPHRYKVSG